MAILSRCINDHIEAICRVSARDSGRTMIDAGLGEVLVTLEKLAWLSSQGEKYLRPEVRSSGRVASYKRAWVEWHPRGLMGAIVPWNYPFHNMLNPISAALFAGNGILIKVSEHASWSSLFYLRLVRACLAAAGAPEDLVQVVTGCGETGAALVGCVDKVIFVGSTKVGKLVMAEAAKTLTPVTLELGGKDPLILLPGADIDAVMQTALRAGFGASGQNCMGAERFFVHVSLLDEFTTRIAKAAQSMRQGCPLNEFSNTGVDIGAMCMPGEVERISAIVDEAISAGVRVLAGGRPSFQDHFFPPTVLLLPEPQSEESRALRLLNEEIFGPLITIFPFTSDEEVINMANDCQFALGANVWGKPAHVRAVGAQIESGFLSHNDFATTYMCQSLPMGGLKMSGFGKFAGVEGLRDCCNTKAVVEDWPSWIFGVRTFIRTSVPPPLCYPLSDVAFPFLSGLVSFFYGHSLAAKLKGVCTLLGCLIFDKPKKN